MVHRSALLALLVIVLLAVGNVPALADDGAFTDPFQLLPWAAVVAWLVPIGLGLLACGAVPAGSVSNVIRTGWLALGVAAIGYWLCGFAFQFGGVGFVTDHPDLAGLVREWTWSPLSEMWGTQWGVLGLEGYVLRGPAATPTSLSLFFAQLPWLTTAVAIPLWSLQGRVKPFALFLSSILMAFVYTLLGNWNWGGGWLANLGLNLDLGHGFIDLNGASAVHLAGAASAFAGMLAFGARTGVREAVEQLSLPTMRATTLQYRIAEDGETYVPMPPLHLPLLATLGTWLALIGSLGWVWSTPAYITGGLQPSWAEMGIGLLLAAGGGAMAALAYGWLTTGKGNTLMTARGVLGALVAAGAGLPFLPLWAALTIGVGAGLIVPLVQYLIEHVLRLDDPTSSIATHGVPAVWGLLAVAIFADGHAGEGWNRISGTGVAGYLAATRDAAVWPGQFHAQAAGTLATFLTAFVLAWFLYAAIQSVTRAWRGEYTVRLPRRPPVKRTRPQRGDRRIGPRIHYVRAAAQETEQALNAESLTAPARPKKVFDLSWIRSWSQDAWKGIIALSKGRPRAPTREVADSTESAEHVDGDG